MSKTTTTYLPRRLQNQFTNFAGPDSLRSMLFASLGNPISVGYFDDFIGTGAGTWPASQNWSYPATVGTGTEVIVQTTAAQGGVLTLTTGGSTNDGAYQYLGRHWRGTEGAYYICRAKISSVSSAKFELGLTDSITNEGAIATKATPTFTATDAAVFAFDTTDDANVTFITANAGVVGANADAGLTLDTAYHVYEIVLKGGFASGYIDGVFIGGGALTSTVALTPGMGVTTRTGSTKALTVDYQGCFGPRSAT